MNKKIIFSIIISLCVIIIAACSGKNLATTDQRWANYKNWNKITEGRVLTGDPSESLGDVHRAPRGYREVYVNNIGLETINGKAPYKYPVGTVIVKEQYKNKDAWIAKKSPEHTIMVKVTDSIEPDEINWMWSASLKKEAKPNGFCSDCHSIVEENDFVFTNEEFFRSMK
jgi:hypothetical protein